MFVGTVYDEALEPVGDGPLQWTVHRVAVGQILRGSVDSVNVTLVPAVSPSIDHIASAKPGTSMMSTCDFDFERGRQYVIYATRTAAGKWTTSQCSGTKLFEEARDDIEFASIAPFAPPVGRVYGAIERMVADPVDPDQMTVIAAAGVPVALTSTEQTITTVTDSAGRLDVAVPPGSYRINPQVPRTVHVFGGFLEPLSVPARGCQPINFSLMTNGGIGGQLVHDDGTPATRVSVVAIPVNVRDVWNANSDLVGGTASDAAGRFLINPLLPGRYYLVVNGRFGPQQHSPYATTYFPGTPDKNSAEVVELGDGEQKTGFTLTVDRLSQTTITGRVVSDDGAPVAQARVSAAVVGHERTLTAFAQTDSAGTFQLPLFGGLAYVMRASVRTPNGVSEGSTTVRVTDTMEQVPIVVPSR